MSQIKYQQGEGNIRQPVAGVRDHLADEKEAEVAISERKKGVLYGTAEAIPIILDKDIIHCVFHRGFSEFLTAAMRSRSSIALSRAGNSLSEMVDSMTWANHALREA